VYLCICHAVTDTEIAQLVAAGASTEAAIAEACGAGTGCGSCLDRICAMIGAAAREDDRVALTPTG
jgi:bacterioferritin-associated ferredoxin